MPNAVHSSDLFANLTRLVNQLPEVMGLQPMEWLSLLLIAAVFYVFILGNPSRSR